MKKLICLVLLASGLSLATHAQDAPASPLPYFNGYQQYNLNLAKVDSAFYFLQKLASHPSYESLLKDLLHNVVALEMANPTPRFKNDSAGVRNQVAFNQAIFAKIAADTTRLLTAVAQPIVNWNKVMNAKGDIKALGEQAKVFLTESLTDEHFYAHLAGRYGLAIYYALGKHPSLAPLATEYQKVIQAKLENYLASPKPPSYWEAQKRAWHRYLYAHLHNHLAGLAPHPDQKLALLKTAYHFSPDLADKGNQMGYGYEINFLDGKASFEEEYLAQLRGLPNKQPETLDVMVSMALKDPKYKEPLRNFYDQQKPSPQSFREFWQQAIDRSAAPTPLISLVKLDDQTFNHTALVGKWVFIDLWGTWCGPCRQEHPDLEKFYQTTILPNPDKITILTIACRDKKEDVVKYMKEHHYTFPVALSDNKIEKSLAVTGFPGKFLITPSGKHLTVPFGADWVDFVRKYTDL
ncbi:MAG: TlpA family protein disulfide reductase [Bernardetiaceae bacterium]|jgi:thiol-disulfide isomerase/thioredoxin|nr:TlpA family protein disulfide reductase [Bernardetiaceae bacterium]